MRTTRVILTTSIAAIAITLIPAFAQAAAEETEAYTGGEIIVTAWRQNERLIDVPVSVTVLSADTLAKARIERAESIVQLTPGVTIITGSAEPGDTQINTRGINRGGRRRELNGLGR